MSDLQSLTTSSAHHSSVTTVRLKGGWHAEVFHSWELPSSIFSFWNEAALAYGDRGLFLLPGWFQTWWSVFGKKDRLFITVLYSNSILQGIFPCWLDSEGVIRALAHGGYFDFLVDNSNRAGVLDKFLELLANTGHTKADFPCLSCEESNTITLLDSLRRNHFPHWQWVESFAPIVNVGYATWEELENTFQSKLRNNLKKGRRRAEKEGTLKFEEVRDSASIDQTLTEAFEVEASGWKARSGTAIIQDPVKVEWFRRISLWAAKHGMLRLYLLRLNDRLIAFDLDLEFGRTVFALKTGYDESIATRFSPGNLMRSETLKLLVGRPEIDCYNFLGPVFPWKLEWTQDAGRTTEIFIYPRSLRGWTEYTVKFGWKQPLKKAHRLIFSHS